MGNLCGTCVINTLDVREKITDLKFKGRGQRATPVTDVKGIVEVIMLLPGRHAARVRRQAAELLCRYLGGDLALVDEVCRIRCFQEEMAVQRPRVQGGRGKMQGARYKVHGAR